jgi:hypothetical protein
MVKTIVDRNNFPISLKELKKYEILKHSYYNTLQCYNCSRECYVDKPHLTEEQVFGRCQRCFGIYPNKRPRHIKDYREFFNYKEILSCPIHNIT